MKLLEWIGLGAVAGVGILIWSKRDLVKDAFRSTQSLLDQAALELYNVPAMEAESARWNEWAITSAEARTQARINARQIRIRDNATYRNNQIGEYVKAIQSRNVSLAAEIREDFVAIGLEHLLP